MYYIFRDEYREYLRNANQRTAANFRRFDNMVTNISENRWTINWKFFCLADKIVDNYQQVYGKDIL